MSKKIFEKLQAIFGIVGLTTILIIFWYTPGVYTDNLTKEYNIYQEIKSYTKLSELEEYLLKNDINYKKEIGDVYIYPDSNKKYEIQFITLNDECKIIPTEFAINFEKIDNKEGVNIKKKDNKKYFSIEKDNKEYIYYDCEYYVITMNKIIFNISKVIMTIFIIFFDLILIYIAFFWNEKRSQK